MALARCRPPRGEESGVRCNSSSAWGDVVLATTTPCAHVVQATGAIQGRGPHQGMVLCSTTPGERRDVVCGRDVGSRGAHGGMVAG